MSKKSYKKLQNRLYREIKHRMALEHIKPIKIIYEDRHIDTLAIESAIPLSHMQYIDDCEDHIKREMAYKLGNKLYEDKYITYQTSINADELTGPIKIIRAKIGVAKNNRYE